MKRFVEGEDRSQSTLFPERLDDYIAEDNPVRVIDAFVDEPDLAGLGFERVQPQVTGRPGYHPASLLKIYVYGYLNRIQSSRLPLAVAVTLQIVKLGSTRTEHHLVDYRHPPNSRDISLNI